MLSTESLADVFGYFVDRYEQESGSQLKGGVVAPDGGVVLEVRVAAE